MSNVNQSPHRAQILDLWNANFSTLEIAMSIFGDRRREADVYNELAEIKGETEPHPRAVKNSAIENARIRDRLREIRSAHV